MKHVLPRLQAQPKRPWISQHTLELITKRNLARGDGRYPLGKVLKRQVRTCAKTDRKNSGEELADESWQSIYRLRKGPTKKYVGIQNVHSEVVDSSQRSETLAQYFERIQWGICFTHLVPVASSPINENIFLFRDDFASEELRKVLQKLKIGKSGGHVNIAPEIWKYVADDDCAMSQLLDLCNRCWREKSLPQSWKKPKVVLLFQKGGSCLPENYRPIALLPVGYKVLASLIHQRLLDSSMD